MSKKIISRNYTMSLFFVKFIYFIYIKIYILTQVKNDKALIFHIKKDNKYFSEYIYIAK